MTPKELEKKIRSIWKDFYKAEKTLFDNNSNERSVSHKFAEYLQEEYESIYNVDCEYSRIGAKNVIIKRFGYPVQTHTDNTEARTVFPDIIIHNRGKNEEGNNFLIIELKKKGASKKDIKNDYEKLKAFLTGDVVDSESKKILSPKYQLGCFLQFNPQGKATLEIYTENEIKTLNQKISETNSRDNS